MSPAAATTQQFRLPVDPQRRRTTLALGAFGALTAVYLAYAALVSPWLVPSAVRGPVQVNVPPQPPPPPQGVATARQWLPAHGWAADETGYMLRTGSPEAANDDAFVYFDEWQPVDEDQAARFRPFAMVWRPANHPPGAEPYTIEADSAYVRFASKFDVADANAGRVVGGALRGRVVIRGPDGLVVLGRDFTFSEKAMRIWTADPVRIAFGPHRGTAQGFQADLIRDDAAYAQDRLAASGIRSVRLLRNVELNLEFRDGDSEVAAAGQQPPGEPPGAEADPPRSVAIRCVGSLEYRVDESTAIFEENVRLDSPDPEDGSLFDRLRCDTLTLLFEPKPIEDGDPADAAAGMSASTSNLTFRHLIADGPQVALVSDKNELQAIATRVFYDVRTRVAQLTDQRPARVFQAASELQSPEITLEHNEDGDITLAWCKGPGWLRAHDERTGEISFDARWQTMLRKYPDPHAPLDIVELEDKAVVRQPREQFGLAAAFIRMWVERDDRERVDEVRPLGPGEQREEDDDYRPRRLLALGDVALVSPQLEAETPRLEVRFDDLPPTASPEHPALTAVRSNQPAGQSQPTRTTLLTSRRVDAGHSPPGFAPADSLDAQSRRPRPMPEIPVQVAADLIRVQVFLVPRPPEDRSSQQLAGRSSAASDDGRSYEPFVSQVWTEGNVNVRQAHAEGEQPLAITGQRAEIHNRGPDDQVLRVFGQPAHIRDRGLHIEGRAIHFDRAANLASVDGAGLLQLPVRQDLEGRELTEPKLLDIQWTEQMTFDGLAARFYGGVKAVLDDSSMRSEEMDVLLTERLSFREDLNRAGSRSRRPGGTGLQDDAVAGAAPARQAGPASDAHEVKIDRVICRDGVEFDSYLYTENKLDEIRRGHVAWFELNHQTGLTEARGPGWIRFWRRGRGKRAAMTPNAVVQANEPLEPDASEWEFTRIDFSGRAVGNVRERSTTFHDRVRILYGPVERPLATIELDDLPRDAGWMSSDALRIGQREAPRQEHAGGDGPSGYIELRAIGNAELEGRSFNAQADEISYDESKGLYILQSRGSRHATIWHQDQPGAENSQMDAQRIEFIPARNHLRALRTSSLSGVQ